MKSESVRFLSERHVHARAPSPLTPRAIPASPDGAGCRANAWPDAITPCCVPSSTQGLEELHLEERTSHSPLNSLPPDGVKELILRNVDGDDALPTLAKELHAMLPPGAVVHLQRQVATLPTRVSGRCDLQNCGGDVFFKYTALRNLLERGRTIERPVYTLRAHEKCPEIPSLSMPRNPHARAIAKIRELWSRLPPAEASALLLELQASTQ